MTAPKKSTAGHCANERRDCGIRMGFLIAFLSYALLGPFCMLDTASAHETAAPVPHAHHQIADCDHCPDASSEGGCADHCLSQAKTVFPVTNGAFASPVIAGAPVGETPIPLPVMAVAWDSARERPPQPSIVGTVVLRE